MSRTLALFLARWILVFASACSGVAEVRRVTIVHTNDLHARLLPNRNVGGFAEIAAMVGRERANDAVLYLNAGDLVQGTPVSTLFQGSPLFQISNRMHMDVGCFGNHEFDYGWRKALDYTKSARYPIVAANVVGPENKPVAPPFVIKTVNGVRIAIIGAVMGNLLDLATPQRLGPLRALPVVETVARYARELKQQSDLVVLLGHIQVAEAREVLRAIPEISVVIKGHNHEGTEKAIEVEDRIAVWCKSDGVEIGRLDLDVDLSSKRLASWQWKRLRVDAAAITPDKEVKKAVDHWEKRVSKLVDVRIAEARRDYDRAAVRGLVEQALLEEAHADFTWVNPGGIRDGLTKGPVLARNIWNLMPFDNQIVTASVPGSLVPAPLR